MPAALLVLVLSVCCASFCSEAHPIGAVTLFDSDPNHIWNQTYECLLIRQAPDGKEYGADALDPLLWDSTHHLLTGDSHRRALNCLDEFLRTHAERLITDPLKRAILQRDLWAVFDWAARGDDPLQARLELETRLARVIRRLALTETELRQVPDTYAEAVAAKQFASEYESKNPQQPFLPPNLFAPSSPWICISSHTAEPTAIVHFSGRSRFLILMQLPGGRDATLEYLRKLRSSAQSPLIHDYLLNLALPQFPVGTQLALVRQTILIDSSGELVPTPLIESIQLRVYHAITPGTRYVNFINGPSSHDQDFFEFRMSPRELLAGRNNGLVAVVPADTEFATFATHGMDPFESDTHLDGRGAILSRCRGCHSDSGIHSVQSRTQWINGSSLDWLVNGNSDSAISWETKATMAHKKQQAGFKLLRKLWQTTIVSQ